MKFSNLELQMKHVEEVLRNDVMIGSAIAHDGKNKKFVFNPWANEYRVIHGDVDIDGGQAVEELLAVYNDL